MGWEREWPGSRDINLDGTRGGVFVILDARVSSQGLGLLEQEANPGLAFDTTARALGLVTWGVVRVGFCRLESKPWAPGCGYFCEGCVKLNPEGCRRVNKESFGACQGFQGLDRVLGLEK